MPPFKVVSFIPLENEAVELARKVPEIELVMFKSIPSREDVLNAVPGSAAIILLSLVTIDRVVLDAAGPQLKVISTYSIGYDNIDVHECAKRGIKVGYTKELGADLVAEFALGLLLNSSRRITQSVLATREKTGNSLKERKDLSIGSPADVRQRVPNAFCDSNYQVHTWRLISALINSTVGIFGLGQIGLHIVERLSGFRVKKTIYRNRKPNPDADRLGCELVSFERLLSESDFLICACSANPDTQGIFNMQAFKQMKPTALFINVSRGSVVDHDDLGKALSSGVIWGAGLDVTTPEPLPASHKLYTLANCTITPHIAWAEKSVNIARSVCVVNHVLWVLDRTDSERGVYVDLPKS